ncbi:MAG: archaetidylserine decarboxylase [Planctomycetota bacterium]
MNDPLSLRILRYCPRNLISRLFGGVARCTWPRFLARGMIRSWAGRFEVDLEEADRPLEEYPSLLAFFTRELKPGARPVAGGEELLVSPVDGRLGAFGEIEGGRLIQAKGMEYSLAALLGADAAAAPFLGGKFLTLYLSPRDYHRIHSPAAGRIRESLYEPGTLWPVNPPAVATIPSLFAVNERVTARIDTERGEVAVVMVGATNVGSIRLTYADFVTNRGAGRRVLQHVPPVLVERGDPIGIFQLGSTVVLLVGHSGFQWSGDLEPGQFHRMGGGLGRYPDGTE